MRQFVWCLPAQPVKWDQTKVLADEIARRVSGVPRGYVPADYEQLTAAVDLGKYLVHWIVVAWKSDATGHVVDYGRLEVPSTDLGVEQGLLNALRQFRDLVMTGWPQLENRRGPVVPRQVWIDAGYMAPAVYSFCRETGNRFRPAFGRGASQQRAQWYNRPTKTGSTVLIIGEGYHFNLQTAERMLSVEVDADYWKTWVHERLATPLGTPGALTLFQGTPQDHLALSKHLTAETKTEEFVAGKGLVVRWDRQQRQNHWFDALYNAFAAGRYCGARLLNEAKKAAQPARVVYSPDDAGGTTIDLGATRWSADVNLRSEGYESR
jgi:phage terminase large subunit GpA-like protein